MSKSTVGKSAMIVVVILAAFVAGFFFHRAGLQRDVIYLLNRTVNLAWPADVPVPHHLRFEQCGCVDYPRRCPCGIRGEEPIYEVSLWRQFEALDPGFSFEVNPAFPSLLRESVGFDNILPRETEGGADVVQVSESPFGADGTLRDLRFNYKHPKLSLRGLLATHEAQADQLVIVLHGIAGNEEAVMGVREEDYLRMVGRKLFDLGYDVLAPSVTSNPVAAGAMNISLGLLGTQMYGVWSRLMCDAASHLRRENGYKRVVLYGLSNGGIITKHATALCAQFDLSVIDDMRVDFRESAWNHKEQVESPKWPYVLHYRRPLLAESSVVDWLHFAKNPLVVLHRERYFDETLMPKLGSVFDAAAGISPDGNIHLVQKRTILHEPELDVLKAILNAEWSELEGYTLTRRP